MSWPDWRRLGVNLQCTHCGRQASVRDGDPIPVCKCRQTPPQFSNHGWVLHPVTGKMVRNHTRDWVAEVIDK